MDCRGNQSTNYITSAVGLKVLLHIEQFLRIWGQYNLEGQSHQQLYISLYLQYTMLTPFVQQNMNTVLNKVILGLFFILKWDSGNLQSDQHF